MARRGATALHGALVAALLLCAVAPALGGCPFAGTSGMAKPAGPRVSPADQAELEARARRLLEAVDEDMSARHSAGDGGKQPAGGPGSTAPARGRALASADGDAEHAAFSDVAAELLLRSLDEAHAEAAAKLDAKLTLVAASPPMRHALKVYSVVRLITTDGLALRSAFHDCGTYVSTNPPATQGGCDGSLRYEYGPENNKGMENLFPSLWLGKQVLDKMHPGAFSWADAYAIAGAAAVFANGGPLVNPGYGRPDTDHANPAQGVAGFGFLAKDFTIDQLLTDWVTNNHFTAQTLCILVGGHTLGISAASTPQGRLSDKAFNNAYYHNVLIGNGFFPSDNALAMSPETLPCVQRCAQDQEYFFTEWIEQYRNMTTWGVPDGVIKY